MGAAHLGANHRHAAVDVGKRRFVFRVRVADVEGVPVELEGEGSNEAACRE